MNVLTPSESNSSSSKDKSLTAKYYYSGFDSSSDTYNSISAGSNGKIYYILSTESVYTGGHFYVYDPDSDQIQFIAELTEACGEKSLNAIPQGKSHVNFFEFEGKLYFATHVGVYERIDGIELPVKSPKNHKPYPGGHILSYDISSGKMNTLAQAPSGEGIIAMTMDQRRGHIYAITWPTGFFIHYSLISGKSVHLGPISGKGEAGTVGDDFRVLPRTMFVNPESASVYYSTSDGDIFEYNPMKETLNKLNDVDLRLDYFGQYDPARPGSMAYHWRSIVWYPPEKAAYGVHATSGYLFRFDPRAKCIEVVERITSEPSKKSGMFDLFYYGYLGFDLGPDQETLYYLTGGPAYKDGKRVQKDEEILIGAKGLENLHLITFHIPTRTYKDHGPVYFSDGQIPTYANSIATDPAGNVYTLAQHMRNGKKITDLVKVSKDSIIL
jgi:hypothetical protein